MEHFHYAQNKKQQHWLTETMGLLLSAYFSHLFTYYRCARLPLSQIYKIMHITWFCQFQGLFSPGHIVPLLLQTVELALKDGQVLQSNVRSQLALKYDSFVRKITI